MLNSLINISEPYVPVIRNMVDSMWADKPVMCTAQFGNCMNIISLRKLQFAGQDIHLLLPFE